MNETTTERLIDSAVRHVQDSNRNLWVTAYQASKVYGLYEDYATSAIAHRAGRHVSTVKSWVNAYRCFAACLVLGCETAKRLRRELSITHFRAAYELGQKYELSTSTQLRYLSIVADYKAEGLRWSVDQLTQEIEADRLNQKAVDWRWHFNRAVGQDMAALLSFDGQLPVTVKRWAQLGQRLKERYTP